jgi:DNA-binding NarL/FixJ family response regulator
MTAEPPRSTARRTRARTKRESSTTSVSIDRLQRRGTSAYSGNGDVVTVRLQRGGHATDGRVSAYLERGGSSVRQANDPAPVIRVLVVEDQPIVGQGVGAALEALGGFEFVGMSRTVDEAVIAAGGLAPDVVVADLSLDDHLAFDLPEKLRAFDVPVLFLTGLASDDTASRARKAGAAGIIGKDQPVERLAAAVRHLADGGQWVTFQGRTLASRGSGGPTDRERQVLQGIVDGQANKEIARAMGIEERTVETHVRRMLNRYGTSSRVQLAVLGLKQGWVTTRGHGFL